jgi:hypothetical protein
MFMKAKPMNSLLNLAAPILNVVSSYMESRKADVAQATGLSEDTVGQVSSVVSSYLTQDEKAAAAIMSEIDKAREADSTLGPLVPQFVNTLRGLVRPLITLVAFFWYVYARSVHIEITGEDYAIIGGIVAFWFGFRPFEKMGTPRKSA